MKRSNKVTIIIAIFFLVIAGVIVARTMIGAHFAKKFGKRPPPGIIVTEVVQKEFSEKIQSFGTAISKKTETFRIQKNELVSDLELEEYVNKGDLIVKLKSSNIVAPFSGILGYRGITEDILGSDSSIIITLDDSSIIYSDIKIPETFATFIKKDLPIEASFSGYKNKIYKGEVDSFASRISEDTRALATRIKMDNSSGEILPGSFLEISIKYDVRNGLSAPDTSTIVEGENVFIYKVDEKNKVMKTKVTIGDRYLGFVEILDGLNNGDKIVAEGTKKVRPNLTIKPIEKGSKKKTRKL